MYFREEKKNPRHMEENEPTGGRKYKKYCSVGGYFLLMLHMHMQNLGCASVLDSMLSTI